MLTGFKYNVGNSESNHCITVLISLYNNILYHDIDEFGTKFLKIIFKKIG